MRPYTLWLETITWRFLLWWPLGIWEPFRAVETFILKQGQLLNRLKRDLWNLYLKLINNKIFSLQFEDIDCRIILCVPETALLALNALDIYRQVSSKKKFKLKSPKVLCLGDFEGIDDNLLNLLDRVDPNNAPEPADVDVKKDTCNIFWSSGTTGAPKGICQTSMAMFNIFGGLISRFQPNSSSLTTTCFFHIGGSMTNIYGLMYRQTANYVSSKKELFMDYSLFHHIF